MCAVEWQALSEIFEMRGGYTPSTKNKDFWEDGILPWFRMEDIREKGNILSDSTLHITPTAVKKNGLFPQNSIILATSATIGEHALLTVPALSNQRFTAFYPKEKYVDRVNCKFAYYVFYLIDEWCKNNIVQGGFASVDMTGLKKYLFPIPSLAKQQEIVSQLDTFTTLISNLESELDMRRKQYEHYRNQLLDFEGVEGVEWKTLGEIAINRDRMRKPITASKRVAGVYPYYGASGIVDYVDGYIFDGNYLLISEDGANLIARSTPIAFPISGKTWVNNHAHVLEFDSLITQRLVEIYLNSIDLTKYISGGAQPKLNQDNLNSILIPSPSINTQQQIVDKLDAFEQLIQSLETEIKLRKQQYEYYREKLLTFEK